MAGRKGGFRHTQRTRDKIQATLLCKRLHDCAMGDVDLSPQQVNAIKILLGKVLPDLSSIEMDGDFSVTEKVTTVELVPLTDDRSSTDSVTH